MRDAAPFRGFAGPFPRRSAAPPAPGIPPAVLADLIYDPVTNRIGVSTNQNAGALLFVLHTAAPPLPGAAIRAAVDGGTAVAAGAVLAPFGTEGSPIDIPVDWSSVPAGTWWLHMTQETSGSGDLEIYATTLVIEVTIAAAPAFDPAALPGARLVFDVSDPSTLFQDAAGTTPVTASGQPLRRMNNRGSLGGAFVNEAADNTRPVYTESGGVRFLAFDGSNDFLQLTLATGLNLSAGYSLFLVLEEGVTPNDARSWFAWAGELTASYNQVNGGRMRSGTTTATAVNWQAGADNSQGFNLGDTTAATLARAVIEFTCVPAGANPNGWFRTRYAADADLVQRATQTVVVSTLHVPNNTTAIRRFTLGCEMNGGGSPSLRNAFANGRAFAGVLIEGALTTEQRSNIRAWCATRAGF